MFVLRALLLFAFFALAAILCAGVPSDGNSYVSAQRVQSLTRELKTLWKRRRGGGSDGDGGSSSESGSSSYHDDDDYSGGDDGGWYTCYPEKNITREAHNNDGYGGYYSVGNGQENSTIGGYTPEGSGTAPRWSNESGSWSLLYGYEITGFHNVDTTLYFGGSIVPYPSGQESPNGMTGEKLENLPYEPDLRRIPSDLLCQVPNSNYAYKYQKEFNWTRFEGRTGNYEYVTTWVPVYCCCALVGLCGCDDFHENDNFVDFLLEELVGNAPRNSSGVCAIDVDDETIILVQGGLSNGSTKADRTVEYLEETVSTTISSRCMSGTGNPGEVSAARIALTGPSHGAFVVAWAATVGIGIIFGMTVVFL
ncbi:uncharacterized protein BDV14DRAFT_198946 [Aspergillus stella-maris]|uniref:uncharacterized protein n=1 Tax=Aspergillus stella-maris TaxID=1810926 RepID=UPI003CCD2EF8